MTRYFLASVEVEGFRGINNEGDPLVLRFRSDAVNSVHSPNGVGKTSIFEALYFAIHNRVPRLERLQDAEQAESYVVNKFHSQGAAAVALRFTSDDGTPAVDIRVRQQSNGTRLVDSPSGHSDPERFLASLREDFALVDYSHFASFVDCSALDRGRSFASLVGLSRYSRLRQSLDGARNTRNINTDLGLATLETEVTTGARSLVNVEDRVTAAFQEVTGRALANINDARQHTADATTALASIPLLKSFLVEKTVLELDFEAAEQSVEREEGGAARRSLDGLNSTVTSLTALAVPQAELDEFEGLLTLARARDEAMRRVGAASIHALLKNALDLITGQDWHDPRQCPVCESVFDGPLRDRLNAKIALYDEAERVDSELTDTTVASACLSKLRRLEEFEGFEIAVADRLSATLARRAQTSTADLESGKARLTALETKRCNAITAATAEIATIQAALPPSLVQVTRTLGQAKNFRDAMREYERDLPLLKEKQQKLAKLNRWKTFITNAAQIFANAETALATARVTDLQINCQDLFGRLVRGGPNVQPTLTRAQNSENVDLKLGDFFGLQNQSARALLSESYRNAVAASIFLAAATRYGGVPRFMVLDDVTSSFDAGHQFSLMDTIRSYLRHGAVGGVQDGLQFIILSHDTSLEKYFDRLNGTTEWHHQKLQGMPPRGRVMASTQEADRLKTHALQHLNAGQVDIGEPFVRQYLEYKLGQVITRLSVPVPPDYVTRGDRRTLSTYMDAIAEAVKLYQAAGRCVLTPQQASDLQTRHSTAIMSNYVSHYESSAGTPFSAYALLGVVQSVDDLAACFMWTDPSDGQLKYYRALDRRA
jgi:DNA repair exonuclease SbcCD ATPase subunit